MAYAALFRNVDAKVQPEPLNVGAMLLHDCLQYIRHVDCHARGSYRPSASRMTGHLLYELVATFTSSIFFRTEPSSMAFMAFSKPSLMLAAFLLM